MQIKWQLDLSPVDKLNLSFLGFLSFLLLLSGLQGAECVALLGINLGVILAIGYISYQRQRTTCAWIQIIHAWYSLPLLLFIYKEMYWVVHLLRTEVYDQYLIQFDRFLFGTDPTHVLARYAHPLLTEIMQIVYTLFYFFPLTIGIALYRKHRYREFKLSLFLILYGFYISYLGYILVPAVGPRFTLHDFYTIDQELPGLWLTSFLREFVNQGESIHSTLPNAIEIVQRDVFPSGHTLITLVTVYLSIIFKSRTRFVFIPLGLILIISTVYLRYHYVADLIGAALLFPLVIWSGKRIFNRWV